MPLTLIQCKLIWHESKLFMIKKWYKCRISHSKILTKYTHICFICMLPIYIYTYIYFLCIFTFPIYIYTYIAYMKLYIRNRYKYLWINKQKSIIFKNPVKKVVQGSNEIVMEHNKTGIWMLLWIKVRFFVSQNWSF